MSFVSVVPDVVGTSATVLASIGNTLAEAQAAAAAPTTSVLAAANDEVSIAIAEVFSGHAQQYHVLSAQAAAFHDQFAQALTAHLRYHRQRDFDPKQLDCAICLEATALWHVARRQDLKAEEPPHELMILIARP